jgi:hypothetical protein
MVSPTDPTNFSGDWDTSSNSGIAGLRRIVNAAKAAGYKTGVTLYMSSAQGSTTKFPSIAPAFMNSSKYGTVDANGGFGGAFSTTGNSIVRFWNAPVAAVIQACCAAIVAAFGADIAFIDPHAEISVNLNTGYSDAQYLAMMSTFAPGLRAQCPKTELKCRATYLTTTSNYKPLQDILVAAFWTMGSFDTLAEPPVKLGKYVGMDLMYRGIQLNYTSPLSITPQPAWRNLVGKGSFHCSIQEDELGPEPPAPTLPAHEGSGQHADFLAHITQQRASLVTFWDDSGVTGPLPNQTAGMIAFAAANPINEPYPDSWPKAA